MKTLKVISTVAISALITIGFTACKEEAQTVETVKQIQAKEGIPVEIVTAKIETAALIKKYSADLKGQYQKSVYAALPEYIQDVKVKIGQVVRKGQVIASLDAAGRSPQLRQAQAQFEIVKSTKERLEELEATGGISKQDLDEVNAQYISAKAAYDAARQNVSIEAPINGVVTDIYMREGEVAIAGKDDYPLMQISDISNIIATIKVPSTQIYDFKVGLKAKIHINGETIEGQVVKVPLAANKVTRYFYVEVLFPNKKSLLRPGVFTQIEVEVKEALGVKVPIDAIVMDAEKAFCFIAQNGIAQKVEFAPLLIADEFVVADSAISENANIITSGLSLLKDGAKIKNINAQQISERGL